MPIYEFKCSKCKKKFERIMSFKDSEDPSKTICDCGYSASKIFPVSNFKLKGDCWAKDGYQRSNSAVDKPLEY